MLVTILDTFTQKAKKTSTDDKIVVGVSKSFIIKVCSMVLICSVAVE